MKKLILLTLLAFISASVVAETSIGAMEFITPIYTAEDIDKKLESIDNKFIKMCAWTADNTNDASEVYIFSQYQIDGAIEYWYTEDKENYIRCSPTGQGDYRWGTTLYVNSAGGLITIRGNSDIFSITLGNYRFTRPAIKEGVVYSTALKEYLKDDETALTNSVNFTAAVQSITDAITPASIGALGNSGEQTLDGTLTVIGNITATQGFDLGYGLGHDHIDAGGIDLSADGDGYLYHADFQDASGTLALLQNLADNFSTNATYAVNDPCVYGGILYRCTTAVTNAGAWASSHWTEATVQDVLDGALEPLLFAEYYPDGSVKSASEFRSDIKYNFDTASHTATVKPFCYTGTAENDNSSLEGRVVIPPFVDAQGNPYISDDGTRFTVTAVGMGSPLSIGITNLTAIVAPNTVTTIGGYAFSYCHSLASVSLPAVTAIEDYAFYGCSSLSAVSLPAATSIGEKAFAGCANITSLSLPAATSIGVDAFSGCASLASVSLPAVTSIGDYAFSGCDSLASVSLPAATTVGELAFDLCTSLTSVSLPSATRIDMRMFRNCTSLASVSLPVATNIMQGAFSSCTSLASVDFGNTPRSSVPTLGADVFSYVPDSCKIIVPDAQYDAWTAETIPDPEHEGETVFNPWYALVQAGYQFLRHSEWEYARKYELSFKAPLDSPALTGTPTAPDIGMDTTSQIVTQNYVDERVDTDSPLVARSFTTPDALGSLNYAPSKRIVFKPEFFGMVSGDRIKSITLQAAATNPSAFDNLHVRIRKFSDDTILGTSEGIKTTATGLAYFTFPFAKSVAITSLNTSEKYYLDFATTPDGTEESYRTELRVGTSRDDYYAYDGNGNAQPTFHPVLNVKFYSWASDLVTDVEAENFVRNNVDNMITNGVSYYNGGTIRLAGWNGIYVGAGSDQITIGEFISSETQANLVDATSTGTGTTNTVFLINNAYNYMQQGSVNVVNLYLPSSSDELKSRSIYFVFECTDATNAEINIKNSGISLLIPNGDATILTPAVGTNVYKFEEVAADKFLVTKTLATEL